MISGSGDEKKCNEPKLAYVLALEIAAQELIHPSIHPDYQVLT